MNIVGLNEILRANAARVILVNSFYSEDVYKILNTKEVKYPAMVFNIQSTTENTNSRTFNGILYYADRLNEGASNESMIHADSDTAIGSFINSLRDSETEDISVSNYTITHFEQKFADECAGGYANLAITVTNDCSVSEVLKFIEVETDPVFKASPAAKITDEMIEKWDEGVSIEQVDEEIESKLSDKNYATKDEIPSLDGYATKVYVNEQIEAVRNEIPSLDGYATEQWVEDKNYATKDEIPSVEGLASEEWVNEQGFLTEHQPLPDYSNTYAMKEHTHPEYVNPDYSTTYQPIGDYATRSEIPSLDGYATEQWVEDKGYTTMEAVESKGYLTEHQDLSEYAKKEELPDLEPYATKQYVQDQIIEAGAVTIEQVDAEIESKLSDKNYATKDEIPSVEGLASEQWVEEQGYLTEHQPLPDYYNTYAAKVHEHPEYVNPDYSTTYQPIGDYATRSEIPSLDGYATEQWVENKNYATKDEIPSVEGLASEEYVNGQIDSVRSEIPSIDGLASEEWVEEQGYLTEHQPLKTINGESIVGEGDIEIQGGGVTEDKVEELIDAHDFATVSQLDSYLPLTGGTLSLENDTNVEFGYFNEDIPGVLSFKNSYVALYENVTDAEGAVIGYTRTVIDGGGSLTKYNEKGEKISKGNTSILTFNDAYTVIADNSVLASHPAVFARNDDKIVRFTSATDSKTTIVAYTGLLLEDDSTKKSTYYKVGYITSDSKLQLNLPTSDVAKEETIATEEWVEGKNYLTEHQSLKTINGESIVGTGNIEIQGGGVSEDKVEELIGAHNFATQSQLSNYLPLSGGTMTGDIYLTSKALVIGTGSNTSGIKANIADANGSMMLWFRYNTTYVGVLGNSSSTYNTVIRSTGDNLYHTTKTGTYKIIDTYNVGELGYATTSQLSSYLPLSGGTMTGPITRSGGGEYRYAHVNSPIVKEASDKSRWYPAMCVRSTSYDFSIGTIEDRFRFIITNRDSTTNNRTDYLLPVRATDKNVLETITTEEWVSSKYLPLTGGRMTGSLDLGSTGSTVSVQTNFFRKVTNVGGIRVSEQIAGDTGYFTIRHYTDNTADQDFMLGPNGAYVGAPGNTSKVVTASELSSYLPLTGGTASTFAVNLSVNNGRSALYGGQNYQTGAFIELHGKEHSTRPGYFYLSANDGTHRKNLIGKPDGTLTWNDKNVVTAANFSFDASTGTLSITV